MRSLICGTLLASVLALGASSVFGQTLYKCTDAAGKPQFSDVPCKEPGIELHLAPVTVDAQTKSQSDARVQREKSLADGMEADRLARERAGYSAQDQQARAAKSIADKLEQDRQTQRTSINSESKGCPQPVCVLGSCPPVTCAAATTP